MHEYKYSLTELESMFPFEREIFITLLNEKIEEERMKLRKQGHG